MIRQNTGRSRNFVKFACAFLVAGWGASSAQAGGADPTGATISTESPIVSIAFAKCSKPLCKLDDDLTISLNVPQSLPADTPVPKMKAVIGAHLIRAADWYTAHEIELPAGDLRPAIGAVKNERLISLATFIGEWKDSPLLDALAKADSSEIPVTLTALDANGEPQGTRGFFRFDAASYFEANRVPLKITAVKCKGLTNRCQLARTMELDVPNLFNWLTAGKRDLQKLQIMIAGHVIPGLDAFSICEPTMDRPSSKCKLAFPLVRHHSNPDNLRAWQVSLPEIRSADDPVNVAVAYDGKQVSNIVSAKFAVTMPPVLAVVPAMILAAFMMLLAVKSNLCRDDSVTDLFSDSPPVEVWPPNSKKPFSLGKVQMVFWTLLVLLSFFYILVATGEWNSITASTVALIGISATTAVGARLADTPAVEWPGKLLSAISEKQRAEQMVANLAEALANSTLSAPDRSKLAEDKVLADEGLAKAKDAVQAAVREKPKSLQPSTGHFFKDLLRANPSETALHRWQMVLFTLLFGGIFLWTTSINLIMPEFSSTVLALIGISSATYVGFKFA